MAGAQVGPKRRKNKKGAAGKKGAVWKFKKKKGRAKQPAAAAAATPADACEESDCGCEETAAGTGQAAISASAEKLLLVTHPPSSAAAGHQTTDLVFVKRPADLKKIESDEVQLAVWRRSSVPGFVTVLSDPTLAVEGLPAFAGTVTPDTVVQTISSRLRAQKNRALADGGVAELVDELDQLVRVFVAITGSNTVHVKLEVLDDNGCAFWHQDSVPYRVCATYRGPCTEWVRKTTPQNKRNPCALLGE